MPTEKSLMQKWVDALRSGAFSQTNGHLKDNIGYCCLGVACEVYRQNTDDPEAEWQPCEEGDEDGDYVERFMGMEGELPKPVQYRLGLEKKSVKLPGHLARKITDDEEDLYDSEGNYVGLEYTLPAINDSLPFTFEEIADILEYNYFLPF